MTPEQKLKEFRQIGRRFAYYEGPNYYKVKDVQALLRKQPNDTLPEWEALATDIIQHIGSRLYCNIGLRYLNTVRKMLNQPQFFRHLYVVAHITDLEVLTTDITDYTVTVTDKNGNVLLNKTTPFMVTPNALYDDEDEYEDEENEWDIDSDDLPDEEENT